MLYSAYRPTPLGRILLAGDGERLTGLWFEGQKYFAASAGDKWLASASKPPLCTVLASCSGVVPNRLLAYCSSACSWAGVGLLIDASSFPGILFLCTRRVRLCGSWWYRIHMAAASCCSR